jgi:hypothetical protein
MSVLCDTSQVAKKIIINFSSFKSRSKQVFLIKDAMFVSLCFIYSLRVSKFDEKRSIELRKNGTKLSLITSTQRLKKEVNFDLLSILLTNKKVI